MDLVSYIFITWSHYKCGGAWNYFIIMVDIKNCERTDCGDIYTVIQLELRLWSLTDAAVFTNKRYSMRYLLQFIFLKCLILLYQKQSKNWFKLFKNINWKSKLLSKNDCHGYTRFDFILNIQYLKWIICMFKRIYEIYI